jgi:hypothetical protein
MKEMIAGVVWLALAASSGPLSAQALNDRNAGRLTEGAVPQAEFAMVRGIFDAGYQNLPGPQNSAWRDYPGADQHFVTGASRLTAIDMDRNHYALRFDDPAIFDFPFIVVIEVGTWILSQAEVANLREYLLRGGFLLVDDFHGSYQWRGFMRGLSQVFPDRAVFEIPVHHEVMHIMYEVDRTRQIAGTMALRYGVTYEHDGYDPRWYGIADDHGRLMVMINHNMDMGDAWELADVPTYPEELTSLAYRFGVNYLIYAMTH